MSTPTDKKTEVADSLNMENVVGSANIGMNIDLEPLSNDLGSKAEYTPESFPGIVYRSAEHKVAILIFRSGEVVATGGKSISQVQKALTELYDDINQLGIEFDRNEPEIQNMVASATVDERLNLNAIAIGLGLEEVEYEPEQFPGLIYRPDTAECVILLFGSGEIVLTGGASRDELYEGIDTVINRLQDLSLL